MRVIYHIDNHAWRMAPVVEAAMDFNKAKGLTDVKVGITPAEIYERYNIPDYLELEKKGPKARPNIGEIPASQIIEYPSSGRAKRILKKINNRSVQLAIHRELSQRDFDRVCEAYYAFFKDAKKKGIPLPDEPTLDYDPKSRTPESLNNKRLIVRAFSQQINNGDKINKEKADLGEDEVIRLVELAFISEKPEPEAHIIISSDKRYTKHLGTYIQNNREFKDKVFIVDPKEFVRSLNQAILIEEYGGADDKMKAAIRHCCFTFKTIKGQEYLKDDKNEDVRALNFSGINGNALTKFFTNPPLESARGH